MKRHLLRLKIMRGRKEDNTKRKDKKRRNNSSGHDSLTEGPLSLKHLPNHVDFKLFNETGRENNEGH